jgi:hypothetical protein
MHGLFFWVWDSVGAVPGTSETQQAFGVTAETLDQTEILYQNFLQ